MPFSFKVFSIIADSHISKLFIDSIVPEATPIQDKPPSSELYTFQPHAEIKSILQYATTKVGTEAVLYPFLVHDLSPGL
jgi:hypothetical protein